MAYDWPGNVRELERLIERAVTVASADTIEVADLPPALRRDHMAALGPSLQRNDTIVKINGAKIGEFELADEEMAKAQILESYQRQWTLTIIRNGQEIQATIQQRTKPSRHKALPKQ